jgi:hypothetical protein
MGEYRVHSKSGGSSGKQLLEYAEERVFFLGIRDLTSAVSQKNMLYGLGKMLYVLDGGAFCVFGPDATITRNKERWTSGFGYGCVIRWSDEGIIFPEMRPNGCGMILAKLEELPQRDELFESIAGLNEEGLEVEGFEIKPDFGKGNHFFEIYKAVEVSPDVQRTMSSRYYAILHCSSPERKDEIYGMVDGGEWVETPLGRISVLVDSAAKEYMKVWDDYNSFCRKRREAIMREVLRDGAVVLDKTHQGLTSMNEIRLGCYDTRDGELFPIALRWDMPVYIMRGNPNLSIDVISRMGFKDRAEKTGLLEELKEVNILPHGGGYKISIPYNEVRVVQKKESRFFILKESKTKKKIISRYGEIIFTNPRELPYDYRGRHVIEKTLEYDLGKPMAKLQPVATLKV